MGQHAGILGYLTRDLPPERVTEAVRRAPWRGDVTGTAIGSTGAIYALGGARASRHGHVAAGIHGRIDNLDDLARDLGVEATDPSAVIAAAYLRFGDEFAGRLLGDFSALVMDEQRGVMIGARDWAGTRPLFWGQHGGVTAFASEVKQVLALLGRPLLIDEATVGAYERMGDPAPDATFVVDVRAVHSNGQVAAQAGTSARSWRRALRFEPVKLTLAEAAREMRARLEVAVGRRTADAERLGALFSGGLDSTAVTATAAAMAERGGGPPVVAGFTMVYPKVPATDESVYARRLAERWAIPWTPVPIDPSDMLTCVEDAVCVHDGPTYPGFCIWRKLLRAVAGAGVDVLLGGEGGDFWLEQTGRELTLSLLRRDWRGYLGWTWWGGRRAPRWIARQAVASVGAALQRRRTEEYFEEDLCDYWVRTVLESEEREAMRAGVRIEFPFCDRELAALLIGLPPAVRASPAASKLVTRSAMSGLVPDAILGRTDMTYGDPVLAAALGPVADGRSRDQELAGRHVVAWRRQLSAGAER